MSYKIEVKNNVVIIKDGESEKKYYWEEGNRFDNIEKSNDTEGPSELGTAIVSVCFLLFSLLFLWAVYQ